MTGENCLHCKISQVIIEHFRAEQGLSGDAYPHFGEDELPILLIAIANVAADVLAPADLDPALLAMRVGLFANKIIQFAAATDRPPAGVRLQ